MKKLLKIAIFFILFVGLSAKQHRDSQPEIKNSAKTETILTLETPFDYSTIPAYAGDPIVEVNGNIPYFTQADLSNSGEWEIYSSLDGLGRCGVAYAKITPSTMPTEERGVIGQVKPSGWHNAKYAGIDGNYIYNRCHLIAYCLAGENANEKNLITGTRYMNTEGMLPYEIFVADYVKDTGNSVLYRVTPIFVGDELVCRGVLIEARTTDGSDDVCFCAFCYNVQPGCTIDYATGYTQGPAYE